MTCVKIRLVVFMVIGLLGSALLPVLNLFVFAQVSFAEYKVEGFGKKLYTFDGIEGLWNKKLMTYGLSGSLKAALVGKEGYLFLGNGYHLNIAQHTGLFDYGSFLASTLEALKTREEYLSDKGIKQLFIIAPDKESVYSEQLPDWYNVTNKTFRPALVARMGDAGIAVIDLTEQLIQKKAQELYLRTDTHWNNYGGYLAYMAAVKQIDPSLDYYDAIEALSPFKFISGDLTVMLKFRLMNWDLEYAFPEALGLKALPISSCPMDANTLVEAACVPFSNTSVAVNSQPFVVHSPKALNNKTLLWIRDSFGIANAPLYQGTFKKTIQVHYSQSQGQAFYALVEKYQPDYIIYQVVERQLLDVR